MTESNNPILYVVLNGELDMSPGKAAAQAVHAAMLLEGNYQGLFVSAYKRTVVVLEAKDGETLKNLMEYMQGADIFGAYYVDERSEKGEPYQITALAVEPIACDDKEKRLVFKDFPLFGSVHGDLKKSHEHLSHYINLHDGWFSVPWYVRKTVSWLKRKI